jgi:hypothetical protein
MLLLLANPHSPGRISWGFSLLYACPASSATPTHLSPFTASTRLPQAARPVAVISLPFDLVGGLIVLRNLPLNDKKGDFVLDTGCSYDLVVKQAELPALTRGLSSTGSVAQQQVQVRSFQFGSAHYANLSAIATSLAPLRRAVGPHLLGLVGYELLRDYEVVIDYAHRRLTCYPLNQVLPRPFVRRDSVAFAVVKGFPVTTATIGQITVRLLLDTGATANNFDAAFSRRLPPAMRPKMLGAEAMLGVAGQQAAQRARLPLLHVGKDDWHDLPVVLMAMARPSSGRPLPYQGILGFTFLCQDVLVSFHYGRHQFYALTPN